MARARDASPVSPTNRPCIVFFVNVVIVVAHVLPIVLVVGQALSIGSAAPNMLYVTRFSSRP